MNPHGLIIATAESWEFVLMRSQEEIHYKGKIIIIITFPESGRMRCYSIYFRQRIYSYSSKNGAAPFCYSYKIN